MGQIVHALIEHSLTPQEILEFPKKLETCPNNEIAGKWDWSNPNFDVETLLKLWNTMQADFLAADSWGDEDFPWLQKENFTLDFFAPNLIAFDRLSNWFFFRDSEIRISEFSKLTRVIGELVNASDFLFVPDPSDDFVYAHEILTVDLFRQDAKSKYRASLEVK
jgi:hypothetical protein